MDVLLLPVALVSVVMPLLVLMRPLVIFSSVGIFAGGILFKLGRCQAFENRSYSDVSLCDGC